MSLSTLLLAPLLSATLSAMALPVTPALPATLCELDRSPHLWGSTVLEVSALLVSSYHGSFLIDGDCDAALPSNGPHSNRPHSNRPHSIDVGCDPSLSPPECDAVQSQLYGPLPGDQSRGIARVTVRARLSPWNGVGYGHLGGFKQRLDLLEVVSSVATSGAALPKESSTPPPDSFMNAIAALREKDRAWAVDFIRKGSPTGDAQCSDEFWITQLRVDQSGGLGLVVGRLGCGPGPDRGSLEWDYVNLYSLDEQSWQERRSSLKPTLGSEVP